MTLLENEPVRARPKHPSLSLPLSLSLFAPYAAPRRSLFVLYTGCGGNRAASSSPVKREGRVGKERERFQGYGMVAPLVSFLPFFFFFFSFVSCFFPRGEENLRLKLDRVGSIARTRGELSIARERERVSRGENCIVSNKLK